MSIIENPETQERIKYIVFQTPHDDLHNPTGAGFSIFAVQEQFVKLCKHINGLRFLSSRKLPHCANCNEDGDKHTKMKRNL